jgi:hypothetical protein
MAVRSEIQKTIERTFIMKKLIFILIAVASLGGAWSAYAQYTPTPTPTSKGGCLNASWNTELYGFCGAKPAMLEKIARIPVKLSERRVFIQITQGSSSGEIKLYERQQDGKFTVTTWSIPETFGLLADIDKAIFDNKGVNCVGEQVTDLLRKRLENPNVTTNVAPPVSPTAAFKHSIDQAQGEFIETKVVILC